MASREPPALACDGAARMASGEPGVLQDLCKQPRSLPHQSRSTASFGVVQLPSGFRKAAHDHRWCRAVAIRLSRSVGATESIHHPGGGGGGRGGMGAAGGWAGRRAGGLAGRLGGQARGWWWRMSFVKGHMSVVLPQAARAQTHFWQAHGLCLADLWYFDVSQATALPSPVRHDVYAQATTKSRRFPCCLCVCSAYLLLCLLPCASYVSQFRHAY